MSANQKAATPTQHPAHSGSVDSPEFRKLMDIWGSAAWGEYDDSDVGQARAALIAHIDTWAARRADEAERDAARYRWLREQPFQTWKQIGFNTMDDKPFVFPYRDREVDALMLAAAPAPNSQPKEDNTKTGK